MSLQIATAPGSWGVEPPADPVDPPWPLVLDEIAAAGFDGVELGPIGYLPEDPERLRGELARRGLSLAGGFVMEPFHRRAERARVFEVARRTCRALTGGGARHVVLIEALTPARAATAGRPDAAWRLDARGWASLLYAVEAVARMAYEEFGLRAAFHPHAGTFVEFADEIERLMAETDPDIVGLCVDTGHAAYAGIEPAELIRVRGDRVRHVHLKDLRPEVLERRLAFEHAVAAGVFCPLGAGAVDLAGVRDALAAIGYAGWATFEQDRLAGDPRARADAEASLRHLRRIGMAGRRPAIERSPA